MSSSPSVNELAPNATLVVHEHFLTDAEADALFAHIAEIPLVSNPTFTVYGKPATMHRDIGFFTNEPGVEGYRYSGQIARSNPLTPVLAEILARVSVSNKFNAILINRYKSKEDSIGAHSDDERALASDSVVAISLGASRVFRIRDKATKQKRIDIKTTHGQMIAMKGSAFQREFTHEIPRGLKGEVDGVRVSLTFRFHRAP